MRETNGTSFVSYLRPTCLESGVVVGLGVALMGLGSLGVVALVVGVDGRLVSFDC